MIPHAMSLGGAKYTEMFCNERTKIVSHFHSLDILGMNE